MANKDEIVQVELFDQLGEVVGILVHIVAFPSLSRLAMAAPVVSDDPIAVLTEKQHLSFPGITGERPTMGKQDRLPHSPVLVSDLGSVFGRDGAHRVAPCSWMVRSNSAFPRSSTRRSEVEGGPD